MYHIAICDNDKNFILYLKKFLANVAACNKIEYKIYEFFSNNELIFNLNKKFHCDLLILDTQYGGIEAAQKFRDRFPASIIIFCSSANVPSAEMFKPLPFRFLPKSQIQSNLSHNIDEILKEMKLSLCEPYIMGHYRNTIMKIRINNILYIKNAKRGSNVIICPNSKEADFIKKFNCPILLDEKPIELVSKFSKYNFAVPHNSYIVNLNHIEYIHNNEILLDNGELLSISRAYQKTFKDFLMKFSHFAISEH